MIDRNRTTADRLGIVASTLCAIHCAGGAFLIGAAGAGRWFADERLESGFVIVAVSLVVIALTRGFRTHGARLPIVLAAVGIALVAIVRGGAIDVAGLESAMSIAGACFLVSAHAANLRAHRRCGCGARDAGRIELAERLDLN